MKRVIISITVIVVVITAFYYLRDHFEREDVEIWDLVPKNAIAVYEVEDGAAIWNEFRNMPVWENLSSIPSLNSFGGELSRIDTVSSGHENLRMMLGNEEFLVSFHKISNTGLGVIFYLPINSVEKRKKLNEILLYYNNQNGVKQNIRSYHNMDIREIGFQETGSVLSYLEHKNFLIGSFTPFLVDDVVRNIASEFDSNFRSEIAAIFEHDPIETDHGNLYVNMARMAELVGILTQPDFEKKTGAMLKWLGGGAYYDISFEGSQVFLNGSATIPVNQDEYFLASFYNQEPQPVSLISHLPNLTATCLIYTFSDFMGWRQSLQEYLKKNFPGQLDREATFLQKNRINEDEFYDWIGREIGLATLQSINIEHPDKLLFIASDEPELGLAILDDLTEDLNEANGDTLLYEIYGGRIIKKMNAEEFPSVILGEAFIGFEDSYYTSLDGYVVIGNSFDVVKMMMNDIEEENTWGKSLNFIRFFENIQKKANLSYFVNFSNSWNSFYGALNDPWKSFFKNYDYQFKHFEQFSFQFSNINNHLYTSAAFQHRPKTFMADIPASFSRDQVVVAQHPIITKPFVVKNHLDRSLEVVFQDSAKYLYLVSSQGEILWRDSIGQKLKADLFQIDCYNNNKLQYFFATDHGLFIIDRNGEYIDGFPVAFGDTIDVEWVNLIDYDNSKRYRMLIADRSGRIYLFDKSGDLLEGWDPREFAGRFSSAPFHLRISGRDCMVALEETGALNLMTRRGEFYSGFPVVFEYGIRSPVFIQRGTDFNRTLIHLVLENGEVNKYNLEGNVVEKNQLYRPDRESNFEIVRDVLNNSYVICRQDYNSISILEPDGDIIIEQELLFSDKLEVQYYNFSAGNEIYALTDNQQGFTYLYDGNGNLMNQRPVESGFRIGLVYSEANNKFQLYSCYGNQFSLSSFFRK